MHVWDDKSVTLKECIFNLIKIMKTNSSEFKALVSFYGPERIEQIWIEYNEMKEKREDSK